MAKKKQTNAAQLVVNEINVGQLNRTPQTITKWQNALRAAESVLNPRRQQLHELYHNILTDGHLSSIMDKRIRAVKIAPINFEGLENDNLKENFQSPWMSDLLKSCMESIFVGPRLVELELINGLVEKVHPLPIQNVNPELGIIAENMYDTVGIDYRSDEYAPWILEIGNKNELGLLHKLAPYVMYKRGNIADYAQYNELFGMPIRIFKYNPYEPESRKQADEAAKKTGAAAYIVIPEGVEFDIKEGNHASASTTFKDFHNLMNDEMSITVLGQTLTTSNDGVGSNALGKVHKEVEEGVNLEDKLMTEYVLNWDFKWMLQQHGYPLDGVKFKFDSTEVLPVEKKIDVYMKLNNIIELDPAFIYEEFNVEIPEGGPKLKVAPQLPQFPQFPPTGRPSKEEKGEEEVKIDEESKKLSANIRQLYADVKPERFKKMITLSTSDRLESTIERIIRQLYNGTMQPGEIDEELYLLLARELFKGVEEGFGAKLGSLDTHDPDYELLQQLQENVYVFSGAKTYHELREISDLLLTSEGTIRSFSDFKREALKIHEQYNVHHLKTEYNAALGNAQMSRYWQQVVAQKETLPYLQLDVVLDAVTRHGKWDKVTAPVDHPVWRYLTPLLDWGCRCRLRQLQHAEVTPSEHLPTEDLLKENFRFNPGIDKVVFPKSHPYFEVLQQDTHRAANNFNLPGPEQNLSFKQHLTGFYRKLKDYLNV